MYITMPARVQIQGGDPSGTGRGGECAWGGKALLDEFSDHLRHEGRGVLSMANGVILTVRFCEVPVSVFFCDVF